ncbi:MAG: hypothetical protein MZV70_58950 [Desulfobacterales bacterium]|nr:hypothetical protein [Desulfobacterales bacterium]
MRALAPPLLAENPHCLMKIYRFLQDGTPFNLVSHDLGKSRRRRLGQLEALACVDEARALIPFATLGGGGISPHMRPYIEEEVRWYEV